MSTILAMDTSGPHCAVALLSGDRTLTAHEAMDKGQAERLMPLCEEVLASAGCRWSDLTAIAVGTGPGNFTGVRIAVAAARGVALGLGIPAIGVTRLQAAAWGHGTVTVVVDAKRGEVYVQSFPGGAARLQGAADPLPPGPVTGDAAVEALAATIARIAAAGEGSSPPAPFYLRTADALPPADPPPVILP